MRRWKVWLLAGLLTGLVVVAVVRHVTKLHDPQIRVGMTEKEVEQILHGTPPGDDGYNDLSYYGPAGPYSVQYESSSPDWSVYKTALVVHYTGPHGRVEGWEFTSWTTYPGWMKGILQGVGL